MLAGSRRRGVNDQTTPPTPGVMDFRLFASRNFPMGVKRTTGWYCPAGLGAIAGTFQCAMLGSFNFTSGVELKFATLRG